MIQVKQQVDIKTGPAPYQMFDISSFLQFCKTSTLTLMYETDCIFTGLGPSDPHTFLALQYIVICSQSDGLLSGVSTNFSSN